VALEFFKKLVINVLLAAFSMSLPQTGEAAVITEVKQGTVV